jgi:signal transduction histidine kinase
MATNEASSALGPGSDLADALPAQESAAHTARLAPVLMVSGAIVCVGAVAVAAAGSPGNAAFGRGLLELLIVGVPIATGVYALRAPINAGFGIAMLAIGFLWSLTALGQTTASVPYTIGRIATWGIFPGVVYLLLAFPDGRIAKGLDRALFVSVLAVLVVLFIGTAPLVEAYPPKTLWATCTTGCPANALFVLDHQPAILSKLILVREWLVELLWLGLFWSMYRRWRAASPLQQRAISPVFIAGAVLGVFHIGHHTYRQLGGPTDAVIALSSAWTVGIVFVCATFPLGLLRRRTLLAAGLGRLAAGLHNEDPPARVQAAVARALNDPTIEVLFRDAHDGTWRDVEDRVVAWPRPPLPGRASTTIGGDAYGPDLALIHDAALRDDQELLDGVSGVLLAAWRHDRLTADLANAVHDLERSRRRIAEASDRARAEIERDLHDGAQQRLVALRIRLTLAEEQLQRDPAAGARAVHDLASEADRALDELRALAQGVFPSLLIDRGLQDALHSLAHQAPIAIHVSVQGDVTRHPLEIESAIYFTCAEAVQNATKHADGASGIWITLNESPSGLRFEIRDDGAGFTPADNGGRGLRNMHDRVEAAGGQLTLDTDPGRGTRVKGMIPL